MVLDQSMSFEPVTILYKGEVLEQVDLRRRYLYGNFYMLRL